MKLKTYQAESMAAALAKVKRDLGRDAVILSTRTLKRGGVMGIGARTVVEITASDQVAPSRRAVGAAPSASATAMAVPAPRRRAPLAEYPRETSVIGDVQRELHDLKNIVKSLVRQDQRDQMAGLPVELREAYLKLVQNEVAEELAGDLVRRIDEARTPGHALDPRTVQEQLVRHMSSMLKASCQIKLGDVEGCKIVALIGPTGVGKTTTVAKLAAHFKLREGRRVGLITIDTYRIAAVDQLKTYADIIDTPLEVVMCPADLPIAVKRLSDCDLVLIDTAGRGQFDAERLGELRAYLDSVKPHETHLVLSGNNSRAALLETVDHFGRLGIDHIIFTKLDEAVGVGTLLSVMQKVKARLSYVTTGQDVPDDIEVSDGRRLAQRIIEQNATATGAN